MPPFGPYANDPQLCYEKCIGWPPDRNSRYSPHTTFPGENAQFLPMTDQFTSLTPTAIKEIIVHLDESIAVFDKYKGRMTASELQ